MTNNTPNLDQRLANIEASIAKLDSGWQRQHNLLLDEITVIADEMQTLTQTVDQLAQNANQLTQTMVQFAQNAERDRAEIRQIWQYLLSQRPNGQV